MTKRNWWNAALFSAAVLGSIAAPGCEGERVKSGGQVQVTDQMQKEAEASSNYMDSQAKKPAAAPAKK